MKKVLFSLIVLVSTVVASVEISKSDWGQVAVKDDISSQGCCFTTEIDHD